jgi:hypothetical protein
LPDWLVERGIGETRYARIEKDEIAEARIELEGVISAGTVLKATLLRSGRNGVARDPDGNEYLMPGGAPGVTEGATFDMTVTRSAIPGSEPWKRPLARIASRDDSLVDALDAVAASFPGDWDDLLEEARSGIVRFDGGELRISPTPAMTLIDVDGTLPTRKLAMAGARAAARAIARLDIGGSIGIDLPTISGKTDRQAVGDAIDAILPRPFERTAMNGFGFIQIIRPRRRASLVELAGDRAGFEARALLRRAGLDPPGAKCLVAHPAVTTCLDSRPAWLDALAQQIGGAISLRADAALPISGGYAEPA